MADDTTRVDYLTQEEVDALREEFGVTRPLTGDRYVGVNPKTGERGIFLFNPQGGWMDMTKSTGPRTTYEDGSPITSFADVNANRNWMGRLYDIYRLATGSESFVSSPQTEIGLGQTTYAPFGWTSEYYNSPEFRNLAHQLARGNMSFDEIYKAMQDWHAAKNGASTASTPSTVSGTNNVRLFPNHYLNNFVSNRGAFTSQAPSTLSRSLAPSLPTPFATGLESPTSPSITTPQGTDYVKLLRSFLTAGLFKDYI